jgi:ADP-heptose:LPS heptosyltransferase
MKAIGFNQGQIGDLAMNLITCRAFKLKYPDSHLTFGINKKYQSVAPIFKNNPLIDDIHIWENYDNWPSENDLNYIKSNNFDIIFHPMPKHKNELWYLYHHHTEAMCIMNELEPPKDLQINLTKWFEPNDKYKNCVALTCFSSAGAIRDIPEQVANKAVEYIHSLGLQTIQLGLSSHPKLKTTYPVIGGSIFDDVKIAASCKFLLTTDTGMNWIMSGYQSKLLALYSEQSYPINAPLKNRTPINPNAIYLQGKTIQDINFELIKQSIYNLIK